MNYTAPRELVDLVVGVLYSLGIGLGFAAIKTENWGHTEALLILALGGDIGFDLFAGRSSRVMLRCSCYRTWQHVGLWKVVKH